MIYDLDLNPFYGDLTTLNSIIMSDILWNFDYALIRAVCKQLCL